MTPYLRDIVADMPQFRDRDPPLPLRPRARCSKATVGAPPPAPSILIERGIWLPIAFAVPIGSIAVEYDETIPEGMIDIDGTRVSIVEIAAAAEADHEISARRARDIYGWRDGRS